MMARSPAVPPLGPARVPALSRAAGPRFRRVGLLLVLAAVVVPPVSAGFRDATAATGIVYQHADANTVPRSSVIRAGRVTKTVVSNHAGAAAFDADGDGWTDLIAGRFQLPPVLYRNRGDGTFAEEAGLRGLAAAANAAAFGAGDFDRDGDQDLFVVLHRGARYLLFLNDGRGYFREAAVERGAAVPTTLEEHEGYSIGVVDYDRDGYLDLHVTEWGVPSSTENAAHAVLLRNRGAAAPGFFENVTARAGLVQPAAGAAEHYGFSSVWADFDADGWPDLALVGDFGSSRLYWNNGDGTFTDGTRAAGVGLDEFGMGVAVADYDGDGRLDLFVTSIFDSFFHARGGTHRGNTLYRNLGGRAFAEVARTAGVDRTGWGWGAAFLDFENDGDSDLIVTNGMDASELGPAGPFHDALSDPTQVFLNDGAGRFADITAFSGVGDRGLGKAIVVLDYDRDGDEDVIVTQTFGAPIVYRSDAATTTNRWIQFRFEGRTSNRDGIGVVVRATSAGRTRTHLFQPSNAYIGQREAVLHLGLGEAGGTLEHVEVRWPSGIVQTLTGLETNRRHLVTEPAQVLQPPAFTRQPAGGVFTKDETVVLTADATGHPAPVFVWEKDGVVVPGVSTATLRLARIHPVDAGTYRVTAVNPQGSAVSAAATVRVTIDVAAHSVARWWNEALLDAIRLDRPNPPVHARNLFHLSAAMWDAFWAYEHEGWARAAPLFHEENPGPADWAGGRETAQAQALSHAAYRVLTARFQQSPGRERSLHGFRWLMERLGCDPADARVTGNTPAAVGNRIGLAVLAATRGDGANEAGSYADVTGYAALNAPLVVGLPGATMAAPNHWQPLALRHSVSQNGIVTGEAVQPFVGVNALVTTPFALVKPTPLTLAGDPGPPPQLGTATEAEFLQQALEVIAGSAELDAAEDTTLDISPGARFANPLGTNDGSGYALNPYTGEPYPPNVVRRGDYTRILAEYWADGPESETPPGHWNVIHNEVTDDPRFARRFGGVGPVLSPLAWDVRAYVALNGALHDAACAAWSLKHVYDSARPISMIRYLGGLGQSSDPTGPAYHRQGLPLVPGLVEVVTAASAAPGQRHAHLAEQIGAVAVRGWRRPADRADPGGSVGWLLATEWVPYQLDTFVSPAFPGYVSGHSTFSRAAAEVMTLLTGSTFFPGGLAERRFTAGQFLRVETGPSADVTLQWATYYDAADQAGLSRLYGGIHVRADDLAGRVLGSQCGFDAFLRAQRLRTARAPARGLRNLSARGRTGTGDDALIAGFVVEGPTQPVLVRSVGPTLRPFGVASFDEDPRLALHAAGESAPRLLNDDWHASPRAARIRATAAAAGAFALGDGTRDAAELAELAPGAYTLVNGSAAPASGGIVLAEVYGDHLVNFSARGRVGAADALLIAGFVLETVDPAVVLVRGVGPALAGFGVARPLADPVVSVYRMQEATPAELVATNDNWSDDPRASLIQDAATRAGAFALARGSRDAAVLLQLPAGVYTVHVAGAAAGEGIALAEVYHLAP